MIDWNEVKKAYDNGLTDAELAERFGVKQNTVKVHRNRSKWGPANRAKRVLKKKRNVTKNVKRNVTKDTTVTDTDTPDTVTVEFETNIASAQDLTKAQMLFCQYYLESYNATQAYRKVYNGTYGSARVRGSMLLADVNIQKYLTDLRKRQANKLFMNANDVLLEYAKRAFANIGDFIHVKKISQERLDEDGNPVTDVNGDPIVDTYNQIYADDSSEMDMSLISEIHKGKDGLVVKLKDDKEALKQLLARLPEPQGEGKKENTFLRALRAGEQQVGDDLPSYEVKRPLRASDDEDEDN